ncbi:MAG: DNA topoisomerase [Oscillospiraceae bacterium]
MSKLIIAEKPSVAKNIAHTIGAYDRISSDNGATFAYYNDEYYVANAVGHLYGLGNPTDYGYSKDFAVSYENGELPMFPDFKTLPTDESKSEIRKFLNDLINKDDITEIICATDAAREGELIFREIYTSSGSTKPCLRFWTSSLTDDAINDALANMKPLSAYENLYQTAKVRNELDWIFGMNLSRLYTALNNSSHRVGRVITPLLGIVVDRDNEIVSFKSTTSYKVLLNGFALSENVYNTEEEAAVVANRDRTSDVRVQKAQKDDRVQNAPKLYSLTRLQQDANDLYGMTAQEVLDTAQKLYEKKYTTYPRTDCEVISTDMVEQLKKTVDMLEAVPEYTEHAKEVKDSGLILDKRVINDDELTDHHAIIPTLQSNVNLSSLSENERKIYDLVANRTLMAVGERYIYTEIEYEFWCNDIIYHAKVKNPVQMGWKKWEKSSKNEENYPIYNEGSVFTPDTLTVKECKTQPPKHFTDATLLSVMENIDNRMERAELKEAVKGKGIGTSATRADAIEKLITSGYAERKGKQIISTEFGRAFVGSLPAQVLSVERTAEWEQKFDDMEKTGASAEGLYNETKQFVTALVQYEGAITDRVQIKDPTAKGFDAVNVGKCPRCGMDVVERKNFYSCSSYKSKEEPGCGFAFSKTHRQGWFEGEITVSKAKNLLSGKSIKLKTTNQKGEKYDANWEIHDDGKYVNIIKAAKPIESIGKCPRCGMDVVETKMTFGCTSYKSKDAPGCGFAIWKEDKRIGTVTAKMAKRVAFKRRNYSKKENR